MEFVYFKALFELAEYENRYMSSEYYDALQLYYNGKAASYEKCIIYYFFGNFDGNDFQQRVAKIWKGYNAEVDLAVEDADYDVPSFEGTLPKPTKRVRCLQFGVKRRNTGSFVN